MAKKIEFVLDVDSKPIDVAVDSTLSLKQAYRELQKELSKTKEGTAEFELLSSKMGDVQDQIDKTTAKSRDLFGSLSLLPGPVGAFAGQVDSAISTLKTFTSFSFKDLKFQLGETIGDFSSIASNIGKATGITKIYTVLNNALASSFVKVGVGEAAAATGARAFAAALTATGIGAIVVALGFLISALMDFVEGSKEAEKATADLNKQLERQQELFELNSNAAKRSNALIIAQMKARGATEKQIRDEQLRQSYKSYEDAYNEEVAARKLYNDNIGKADAEGLKKLEDNLTKREQASKEAYNNYLVLGYSFQAEELKAQQDAAQKTLQENQQKAQKIAQDNATANKKLLDLQNEYELLNAASDAEANKLKLKQDYEAQLREVNLLNINEKKKGELKEQLTKTYNARVKKLRDDELKEISEEYDKLFKETQDANKNLVKLREDLTAAIIEDETKRALEQLRIQFERQKQEIERSKADKLERDAALLALEKKYQFDKAQIEDDAKQKEKDKELKNIDDRLKLLELRGQVLNRATQEYFRNQNELLDEAYKKERLLAEGNAALLLEIEKKYQKDKKNLKDQEIAAYGEVASATISSFANITSALASGYDEEAKTSKEAFEKRKNLQRATAVMSAASGIIQILTQPSTLPSPFDWIVKVANAAALGITTAIQISNINKTQFEGAQGTGTAGTVRGMARGGFIEGPRHAQGGTLIEAEGGEAVMTRGAVTLFGPLLAAMNQMGGGTNFNQDMLTTANDAPATSASGGSQEPVIMKTYVVSNELTTESEKQARLKNLSTL